MATALAQGIIDAKTYRFRHGKEEISLEEAINRRLVDPNTEWMVQPPAGAQEAPTIEEICTESIAESTQKMAPKGGAEEFLTTIKRQRITETSGSGDVGSRKKESAEVPSSGWSIQVNFFSDF